MKYIVKVILVVFIILISVGCTDKKESNSSINEETITNNETSRNSDLDLNKYENSIVLGLIKPSWDFAQKNGIELQNFIERVDVLSILLKDNLDELIDNSICLDMKEKSHFKINRGNYYYFKKTLEKTEILYYGQLNGDSEPEGLGIVFELYDDFSSEEYLPLVKYIGYFESGKFDGYGIEFENPSATEIPNIVDINILKNNSTLFNASSYYEGYFKEGEHSGTGIICTSNLYENSLVYNSTDIIDSNTLIYSFTIGDFSKNNIDGNCVEYLGKNIIYVGEKTESKYDGYGKLYDPDTGELIYEGEFSNGQYHGKGILYDKNGKVLHDGEFVYGDIK